MTHTDHCGRKVVDALKRKKFAFNLNFKNLDILKKIKRSDYKIYNFFNI